MDILFALLVERGRGRNLVPDNLQLCEFMPDVPNNLVEEKKRNCAICLPRYYFCNINAHGRELDERERASFSSNDP